MNGRKAFTMVLGSFLLVAGVARAVDQKDAKKPQMTAEQKAEMEMWMKLGAPGPEHKALEPLAGSFTAKATMWEKPDGAPQVSNGSAESKWVLGGRYLQETFSGEFNGMPFNGIGFTGYDNYKKQYVGTWIDSMSTMVMVSSGIRNNDGSYTFTSQMPDPMTGKQMTVREVVRIADKNQHSFEMYGPDKSGKEFKMMEIVYTRK